MKTSKEVSMELEPSCSSNPCVRPGPYFIKNDSVTSGPYFIKYDSVTSDNRHLQGGMGAADEHPRDNNPQNRTQQQDDNRQRFKPIEFLLSCIAMCVGLGNVWRFPFTAYKNGGGAFLLPYIISLVLIGKPLYFLELAVGQFSSRGQVKIWKLSPVFKGIGYMAAFATCCISSYYCSVMSLSIYYFIASFSTTLPWTVCDPSWEGVECLDDGTALETTFNGTVNSTAETFVAAIYLRKTVTNAKDSIDDGIGLPDWRLTLCLLFAWVLLFIILVNGVKSIGKAAYFTALFPYLVLFIMLGQGLTLDGAWDGILHFITPRWEALLDWKVWYAAVTQCFFSLSVGTGATIMLGSYNRFHHNLHHDAMIITAVDTLTSLLAGCTIFVVLGHLSVLLGKDISEVSKAEANLAFEAYPLILANISWAPQLFAVLFFLMLFTLGIGSSTSDVNGIITIILDRKPNWKKEYVAGSVCLAGFLLGLVYVTPGGGIILDLVDKHGATFVIFITSTLEVIAISWVYGLSNICRDLEFMLKMRISYYWKICWGVITPIALSVLLVLELESFEPLGDVPTSVTVCGWLLSAVAILIVPFCAIQVILRQPEKSLMEKIRNSLKPTEAWGPSQLSDWLKWEENLR